MSTRRSEELLLKVGETHGMVKQMLANQEKQQEHLDALTDRVTKLENHRSWLWGAGVVAAVLLGIPKEQVFAWLTSR